MAINERYRHQVDLLVRTLPFVAEEPVFALKGGTAINLFIRNLPRLSVDIDLTYLPVKSREESLAEIEAALTRIRRALEASRRQVKVIESRLHKERTLTRLVVRDPSAQIKVEVTPVTRGCVYEPRTMAVCDAVEDQFSFAETQVVSFDDLYAGKLVAALDRQHPRDLFDVRDLFANEGVSATLRNAFLVFILSHNRPACEVLAPIRKDLRDEFDRNFDGMTDEPVSLDALLETREQMIEVLVAQMPDVHRTFLIDVERGMQDWTTLDLQGVADLPAVRWKLANMEKVDGDRRQKFAERLSCIWQS